MLTAIRTALAARHKAVIEAEALVANGDYAGLRRTMDLAADPYLPHDVRLHHERVVVIALRRRRELHFADRRTKDTIIDRWSWRTGFQVRFGCSCTSPSWLPLPS